MLGTAGMRQFDQRVSLKARLQPLTRDDVDAYVAHRVAVARGSTAVIFERTAIERLFEISRGVPRVINLLCDRALMLGARSGVAAITSGMVEDAARALSLHEDRAEVIRRRTPAWLTVAGIVAALLLLLVLAMTLPL
jgi:general secretion pathway protein A